MPACALEDMVAGSGMVVMSGAVVEGCCCCGVSFGGARSVVVSEKTRKKVDGEGVSGRAPSRPNYREGDETSKGDVVWRYIGEEEGKK